MKNWGVKHKMILKHTGIVNVKCGKNFTAIEPCNIYNCIIGDDVFVGPFVEIQNKVFIGHRVKIQSHSFLCEGVKVGNDCVIAHSVNFVNDKFKTGKPSYGNKNLWEKTSLGNNVLCGSNATILPVNICSNVVIGAGSVVTKDISISGVYIGNPAKFLRKI